ncbi:MAG: hypothetical protein QOF84_2427 [Streptomyces sp.]|jgi:hypothetical protein|nr:hypothetical protein [Streptomyces sp.]
MAEALTRLRAVAGRPATASLASAAAGISAAVYLYGTNPHQPGHWLPRCPFNWVTGLYCPACGGTRMVYDLMHGDLSAAFHDNMLLLIVSPAGLFLYLRWFAEGLQGRVFRPTLKPRAQAVVLGIAVLWAVVRNLH